MVIAAVQSSNIQAGESNKISLEEWMQNPPENMEWVNGELVEKAGMTLKHSRIQAKLAAYWRNYKESSGQGGEVYTEAPCRTNRQGRKPDVAYLTSELLAQFGEAAALPQSFPLCAEIVSSTDFAEEIIAKSQEYLQSGGEEVWLIFPENKWIIVVTQNRQIVFTSGTTVSTQTVLQGFSIAVDELLA
ncbi:Uma2 family endonuclease [Microcoleus sp. FACHB-672]|uniref:Uma2 family endonuclease n=1 Tax=Microcoleus sp. FACHB-672 TaxID=2692825 RepID=UPI00168439FA|nr:Uma2 family endonuclease [Microcoleus sp. FACHB-672]MBD2040383.1 Uma2 family endonuclease [Microcoleus sp. FACHB-672]